MTWGRGSGVAAVLALALLAAGCSSKDEPVKSDSAVSPTSAVSAAPSVTPSASASATASATPSATPSESPSRAPSACTPVTRKAVPDGTWQGPVTMRMRGANGNSGYADSTGTGTLTAVVRDGAVKSGSWTLTWKSKGHVDTGQAEASVTLDGKVAGPVKGTAAKPKVTGTWTIDGQAVVNANGQTYTQPIDETGTDTATMTVAADSCDKVAGTFVPSFTSKETMVTFTGTARWSGSRVR